MTANSVRLRQKASIWIVEIPIARELEARGWTIQAFHKEKGTAIQMAIDLLVKKSEWADNWLWAINRGELRLMKRQRKELWKMYEKLGRQSYKNQGT